MEASAQLRLVYMSPDELLENEFNWRRHPQSQMAVLNDVIDEVGWAGACLFNERTGRLVDGHARRKIAIEKGVDKVPVLVGSWDEATEKKILATLDPIAGMAETDDAKLSELIGTIETNSSAIDSLLKEIGNIEIPINDNDAEPQIDRAEELRQKWGVETGQLWELGEHRLLCGDSTKAEDWERACQGIVIDAVVTDPPYGVDVNYDTFDDSESSAKELIDKFMPLVARQPRAALTTGHRLMWHYPRPAWVMAWIHPAGMGMNPWGFTEFNPILVYGRCPYLKNGLGSRGDAVVMAADRQGVDGHPTPKPIKVWSWLVERMSPNRGEIIFDPFSGSGTTIIACGQLGRRCRAIEISPAYVGVALERWHQATGKTPRLV